MNEKKLGYLRWGVLAVAAILVVYGLKLTLSYALNVSTPFVVVEGSSMLPSLYTGDIVIIHKPSPDKIKIGDIIVYRSLRGNLVIHRVVEVTTAPYCKPVCYITKGDNNLHPDNMIGLEPPKGVSYSEIIGVVITVHVGLGESKAKVPVRIPYMGLLSFYLRS
ncbi:signal peptidase I [Hyperthermus butylicus]|uniref:signal peptidase I n=1 Tax=Hyperthermus butylicus TaxID=54248 RepID=UPI001891074A|nr:signal peptidase I [Hyperthermus butylicus]